MEPDNKIFLFPGAFQRIENYSGFEGVDIWKGQKVFDEMKDSDCFVGHSAGASFAVHFCPNQTSKYILVNPLLKKRSRPEIFLRWLKFHLKEGIKEKKIVPVRHWLGAAKKVYEVLEIDILSDIRQIPKENVVVIRGKNDVFFCDEEAAEVAKENGIKLIEIDAGHDWNKTLAEAVRNIISN